MYIWRITVEVKWSYQGKDEGGDEEDYTVAAETFEKAMIKVRKLALAKSRKFTDEIENEKHTYWPTEVADVVKVERGDYLDA